MLPCQWYFTMAVEQMNALVDRKNVELRYQVDPTGIQSLVVSEAYLCS